MESVTIAGYMALSIMGFTLGLLGAGGSILTLPILIYLFKIPILQASSYSLFLVGSNALLGTLKKRNVIPYQRCIVFLVPSLVGVFLIRHYALSNLPTTIAHIAIESLLTTLLVVLMLVAGYLMMRPFTGISQLPKTLSPLQVSLFGLGLGSLLGLLGAGGGFLMIPTLVLMVGMPMSEAVAASLFIITCNTWVGFWVDPHHFSRHEWQRLIGFMTVAMLGMLGGLYTSQFCDNQKLKKYFGGVVVLIAAIVACETWLLS